MRHGVRRDERVCVVAADAETGRDTLFWVEVFVRYVDGITFSVTGGGLYFTTEEGVRWCRDDPEDVAALKATLVMAL